MNAYWAISADEMLAMLRQVEAGDSPDVVYMEHYANCQSYPVEEES